MKKPWYYFLIPQRAIDYITIRATQEIADKIADFQENLRYPKATKELLRRMEFLFRTQGHLGDLDKLRVFYEDLITYDGHTFDWHKSHFVKGEIAFMETGVALLVEEDGTWCLSNNFLDKPIAKGQSGSWPKEEAQKAYVEYYRKNFPQQ